MKEPSPTRQNWFSPVLAVIPLCALIAAAAGGQGMPLAGLGSPALVIYDGNAVPHICTGSDRDTYYMQGFIHAQDRYFQMDFQRRTLSGTLAELVGPGALPSDVQFRTLGLRRAAERSLQAFADSGLDELLEMLDAYAAGVNAFLAGNPLPAEYLALELSQTPPWTPLDSVLVGKGLAFQLSFNLTDLDLSLQAQAYAQAGAAFGFDGMALLLEDVSRPAPFDPTVSLPPDKLNRGEKAAPKLTAPGPQTAELARRFRDRVREVPLLAEALERREEKTGSNWWIVAGAKSATGHAMLANDPHLGLDTPTIFYEAHLISSAEEDCGLSSSDLSGGDRPLQFEPGAATGGTPQKSIGLDVNGVGFAGTPGVVLGCNDRACWGATTNPMDVTDIYQEALVLDPSSGLPAATIFDGAPEPVVLIPQSYRFNQLGDGSSDNLSDAGIGPLDGGLTVVIPRRNNGPVVQILPGDPALALSVQYTGWGATFELEAFRRFQRATGVEEFRSSLQYFDVGSQNFAFADTSGNIAYFTSAEMPIREDLQNLGFPDGGLPPFLIRDGTHGLRHEWLPVQNPQPQQALPFEILPFDEMPQVSNPPAGFVISANNDPIGTTLDNNPLNQLRAGGGLYYLSPGYADGLRAGRIRRSLEALLDGGGRATAADLERLQSNHQLLDAELMMPFVLAAFANGSAQDAPGELRSLVEDPGVVEAVARLMAWDFTTPTGIQEGYDPGDDPAGLAPPSDEEIDRSVAATIWSVFRGQLVRQIIDRTLTNFGLGEFLPGSGRAYSAVAHLRRPLTAGRESDPRESTFSRDPTAGPGSRAGIWCCSRICAAPWICWQVTSWRRPSGAPPSSATTAGASFTASFSITRWADLSASHQAAASSTSQRSCRGSLGPVDSVRSTPPATALGPMV